jgi:hypothetical protein
MKLIATDCHDLAAIAPITANSMAPRMVGT